MSYVLMLLYATCSLGCPQDWRYAGTYTEPVNMVVRYEPVNGNKIMVPIQTSPIRCRKAAAELGRKEGDYKCLEAGSQ